MNAFSHEKFNILNIRIISKESKWNINKMIEIFVNHEKIRVRCNQRLYSSDKSNFCYDAVTIFLIRCNNINTARYLGTLIVPSIPSNLFSHDLIIHK